MIWPLFAFCMLVALVILLFYGTVLVGAFVKVWGINFSFTWAHFKYVMTLGWIPLRNSVVLAMASTPIAGLLGMIIAFLVVRKEFPGRRAMEFISMLTLRSLELLWELGIFSHSMTNHLCGQDRLFC